MNIPVQHTVDTPYMVGPVHCYSIERDNEIILIDTGPPTVAGRQFLQRTFDLQRLSLVLVTHCHIDHYGQAAWLAEHSSATVYVPHRDVQKVLLHDERLRRMDELLMGLGFGRDYREKLRSAIDRGGLSPPFPESYRVAEQGLPAHLGIEVTACPGHSQSDLVYHGDGWAVTGDTLLRGIFQSPLLDVDLDTGARFNNYRAYCTSIVNLAGLRGKTILPGHRQSISGVDETLLFYVTKALQRAGQLKPHLGCASVADIIARLFPDMKDPFHVYLKASEIAFMTDFIEDPGPLRESFSAIGLFGRMEESFAAVVGN